MRRAVVDVGPMRPLGGRQADEVPRETADLLAAIDVEWRAGATLVILSGGSPATRSDFPALARHLRRRGLGLGLVTDGRRLSGAAWAAPPTRATPWNTRSVSTTMAVLSRGCARAASPPGPWGK